MAKKILLADDSITIQKVISITFATEDYELIIASNGDEALTKALETQPDLIMADIVMPGKTGYQVCEAVKGHPNLSHIPVLLLAGTFEPINPQEAQRVGANDHILKPFESEELLTKVHNLLGGGSATPAPQAPAVEPAVAPAQAPPLAPPVAPPLAAPPAAPAVGGEDDFLDFSMDEPSDDEDDAIPTFEMPGEVTSAVPPPAASDFGDLNPTPPPAAPPLAAPPIAPPSVPMTPPMASPASPPMAQAPPIAPPIAPPVADPMPGPGQAPSATSNLWDSNEFQGGAAPAAAPPVAPPVQTAPPVAPPMAQAPPSVPMTPPAAAPTGAPVNVPNLGSIPKQELELAVRQIIEQVVWEVVPDLAEEILKTKAEQIRAIIGGNN